MIYCIAIIAAAGLISSFSPAEGIETEIREFWSPGQDLVVVDEGGAIEGRNIVTEERIVGSFSRLASSGSIPVTYIQSDISKVVIEGSQEFIDKLVTEVQGRTLRIGMKKGNYHNLNLSVTVYSPVLDEVSMAGSGPFTDTKGHQSVGDVKYSSSGSGRITVGSLVCASFSGSLAGSGKLTIDELACGNASLSTSGSGGITVKSLSASKDASLRLAGSGFGLLDSVAVNGDLDLVISGSGSIKVNGRAGNVNASIAGSGSIMGDLDYKHLSTKTAGSGRIRF